MLKTYFLEIQQKRFTKIPQLLSTEKVEKLQALISEYWAAST